MPKNGGSFGKNSKLNNNLGGNQIVYLDQDETQAVKDTIETYNVSANNIEVDKLVKTIYDEWNNSKERKLMLEGISYYANETEINKKVRYDHCGTDASVNDKLSNAKMHKNIMRKLTRQKVNTLLGKPYSIKTDDDNYKKILEEEYFTKYMYRKIFNTTKEAIKEGIKNGLYEKIGEDKTVKLIKEQKIIGTYVYVREKYRNKKTGEIFQAPSDYFRGNSPISNSLVSSAISLKYELDIPITKLSKLIENEFDITISSQNRCNYFEKTADFLSDYYNKIEKEFLTPESKVII